MDTDEGVQSSDSDLLVPQGQSKGKIVRRRNPLSVAQKVAVIRAYDRRPSVRALAVTFRCGRTQVKNILRNRNLHLKEYENTLIDDPPYQKQRISDAIQIVLHEWVSRALCYQIEINDDILMRFGYDIADHVNGCKVFDITSEWITTFRRKYGLSDEKMRIRQKQFNRNEVKKSLNVRNVVDDVRNELGENAIPKVTRLQPDNLDILKEIGKKFRPGKTDASPVISRIVKDPIKSVENEMKPRFQWRLSQQTEDKIENTKESPNGLKIKVKKVAEVNKPVELAIKPLESYQDALNYLGPLEAFLLSMENLRAVGLVNQLENLFRNRLDGDLN